MWELISKINNLGIKLESGDSIHKHLISLNDRYWLSAELTIALLSELEGRITTLENKFE